MRSHSNRRGHFPVLSLVLCVALVLPGGPSLSQETFRSGPLILEEPPADVGKELGFVAWEDVYAGRWPPGFVDRVRASLDGNGRVLLVGQTDPVGPKSLNRSLGLQYAVHASHGLISTLGIEPWRVACASVGEDPASAPGITATRWSPAIPVVSSFANVSTLEPVASLPRGGAFWSLWEPEGQRVVWGLQEAGDIRTWELDILSNPVRLALPAFVRNTAVGAAYRDGTVNTTMERDIPGPSPDVRLELRLASVDAWSARLTAVFPDGYLDPVLWVAGVPYPVVPDPSGEAEVSVALFPQENRAYLQATDLRGHTAVSEVLDLPDGFGDAPDLLVILVWEGENVDLDLHAWRGPLHTSPQDPDPIFSPAAAPGTRLLFDGDDTSRASALMAKRTQDPPKDLSVEVHCYVDFGGKGATAWLYVAERPGDPLESRYRVLGPRRLSERPIEARWAPYSRADRWSPDL